jgi:hypothetical protein
MRRVVAVAAAFAALAAVPGGAAAAKGDAILYAVDARDARLAGATLTLPAATRVTWFTDRPARRSGATTLRRLVGVWAASGFAVDPPNAALILAGADGVRTHVVELRRARLDGRRVAFGLRRVPDANEAGHADTHPLAGGRYARAQLFIDDAALPPCPSTITVAGSCLAAPYATYTASLPWLTGGNPYAWQRLIVDACGVDGATAAVGPSSWGSTEVPACPSQVELAQLVDLPSFGGPSPVSVEAGPGPLELSVSRGY